MFSNKLVYVGAEPNSSRGSFAYAALDSELKLVLLTDGEINNLLDFLADQGEVIIAINSPAKINQGLIREKIKREIQDSHQIRGAELRIAEHELRSRGIPIAGTPSRVDVCPAWMQAGFELYSRLSELGYKDQNKEHPYHQILETNAHAGFCVLLGQQPLPKPTLEGRLQRQLILYEQGVRINDPMEYFEEITRQKLKKGMLPTQVIILPEHLDALLAAFTAWKTIQDPKNTLCIGDEREGKVILPVDILKDQY